MSRIVVTDDDADIREIISYLLKERGHQVELAETGAKGLRLIKEFQPELVLLDVRLPDMDGIDILTELRKYDKDLPIIMISALGDLSLAVKAMKLGANDYLNKPFKNEELLKAVDDNLRAYFRRTPVKKSPLPESVVPPEAPAVKAAQEIKLKTEKKKRKKIKKIILTAFVFLLLAGGAAFYKFYPLGPVGEPLAIYTVSSEHPCGVCGTTDNLWVSDWFTQKIYKYKFKPAFSQVDSYSFPGLYLASLAWDGQTLWSGSPSAKKIFFHKKGTLEISSAFAFPGIHPGGLCSDGQYIWSCDSSQGKVYQHNIDISLSVLKVYPAPGSNPIGLFWDGKHLWSADGQTLKIYRHRKDENFSVSATYLLKDLVKAGIKPTAVSGDRDFIWVTVEGGKIYELVREFLEPEEKDENQSRFAILNFMRRHSPRR